MPFVMPALRPGQQDDSQGGVCQELAAAGHGRNDRTTSAKKQSSVRLAWHGTGKEMPMIAMTVFSDGMNGGIWQCVIPHPEPTPAVCNRPCLGSFLQTAPRPTERKVYPLLTFLLSLCPVSRYNVAYWCLGHNHGKGPPHPLGCRPCEKGKSCTKASERW